MRLLGAIVTLFFVCGCNDSVGKHETEADRTMRYLQAAEMVKAEEVRLSEMQASYDKVNALYLEAFELRLGLPISDESEKSLKKMDETRGKMLSRVAKQRDVVLEMRAKRDSLAPQ